MKHPLIRKVRRKRRGTHHDIVPVSALRSFHKKPVRVRVLGAFALILIVAVGAGVGRPELNAETLTLHPTSCLGGWQNPSHAQGVPETGAEQLPERFTEDNSAVLPANTSAEIYCGGFVADIPPDTRPRSLVVTFSLSAGERPQDVVTDDYASSTGEALDAPDGSSVHVVEPTPEPEPVPEAVPESTPAPDPVPEPDPIPAEEPIVPEPASEPSAFLPRALTAHAQEEPALQPAPAVTNGAFVEVRYTFDGQTWYTLDTLDAAHAVGQSYAVPLPPTATWHDLSGFQASLRALPTADVAPRLYLDGMAVTVAYETSALDPLYDPATGGRHVILNASTGFITSVNQPATSTAPVLELIDTLILADSAPTETGLAIYDEAKDKLLVDTVVGNRKEHAHAASGFGEGTFIVIQTLTPGVCTTATLEECRIQAKQQWSFSVGMRPEVVVPESQTQSSPDQTEQSDIEGEEFEIQPAGDAAAPDASIEAIP